MQLLPLELQQHVLVQVIASYERGNQEQARDLLAFASCLSRTCKGMLEVVNDEYFWKRALHHLFEYAVEVHVSELANPILPSLSKLRFLINCSINLLKPTYTHHSIGGNKHEDCKYAYDPVLGCLLTFVDQITAEKLTLHKVDWPNSNLTLWNTSRTGFFLNRQLQIGVHGNSTFYVHGSRDYPLCISRLNQNHELEMIGHISVQPFRSFWIDGGRVAVSSSQLSVFNFLPILERLGPAKLDFQGSIGMRRGLVDVDGPFVFGGDPTSFKCIDTSQSPASTGRYPISLLDSLVIKRRGHKLLFTIENAGRKEHLHVYRLDSKWKPIHDTLPNGQILAEFRCESVALKECLQIDIGCLPVCQVRTNNVEQLWMEDTLRFTCDDGFTFVNNAPATAFWEHRLEAPPRSPIVTFPAAGTQIMYTQGCQLQTASFCPFFIPAIFDIRNKCSLTISELEGMLESDCQYSRECAFTLLAFSGYHSTAVKACPNFST
jgi:hypothetical protein